jgi:hypothetical protein
MSNNSGDPLTRDFGRRNWQNTVLVATKSIDTLETKVPFFDLTKKFSTDDGTFVS